VFLGVESESSCLAPNGSVVPARAKATDRPVFAIQFVVVELQKPVNFFPAVLRTENLGDVGYLLRGNLPQMQEELEFRSESLVGVIGSEGGSHCL